MIPENNKAEKLVSSRWTPPWSAKDPCRLNSLKILRSLTKVVWRQWLRSTRRQLGESFSLMRSLINWCHHDQIKVRRLEGVEETCACTLFSCMCKMYRETLVVANLGWVYLDLDAPSFGLNMQPILPNCHWPQQMVEHWNLKSAEPRSSTTSVTL